MFQGIMSKFQGCFRKISRVFQDCLKGDSSHLKEEFVML